MLEQGGIRNMDGSRKMESCQEYTSILEAQEVGGIWISFGEAGLFLEQAFRPPASPAAYYLLSFSFVSSFC